MRQYDYLVLGTPEEDGTPSVLAQRGAFAAEGVPAAASSVPVSPFPDGTPALAVMREDDAHFLVAYAYLSRTTYVRVGEQELRALKGDIKPLLTLVRSQLEPPQTLEPVTRWTFEIRREALYRVLEIFDGDMPQVLGLLSGALTGEGLALVHYPASFPRRYQLVQGLLMLLPSPLRYLLTFSLNSAAAPPERPRLIFVQGEYDGPRCCVAWGQAAALDPAGSGQAYCLLLSERWQGDLDSFVRVLMALDKVAFQNGEFRTLAPALDAVVQRSAEPADQPLPVATMTAMLEDDSLDEAVRDETIERLLQAAIEERDAAASHWLASRMETHPALNHQISQRLDALLDTQPDAVYAFVRAHLNAGGALARWLPRLHASARRAFGLVLQSADASSIMSWLQLLAREPERYDMGAIVHDAIVGSIPLAYENAGLARDLLVRAIKRDPAVLLQLLDDHAFQAALAPEVRAALIDQQPAAVQALIDQSRELFLLALARLLRVPHSITHAMADTLWHLYTTYPTLIVSDAYQPLTLLRRVVGRDRSALQEGVLAALLTTILADRQDDLFVDFAALLARDEALTPLLPLVLRTADRSPYDVVNLITRLASSDLLNPQATVNLYVSLLDHAQWDDKTAQPMIDQLGRLVGQSAEVRVPPHALWHLVETSAATRADSSLRGVMRRLLQTVIQEESDDLLVKDLLRLKKATQHQASARLQIMAWWAEYTEELTTAQLHRLEKLLEGQRPLDDLRDSLATFIGVRKQFATQDLRQWAEDIATAYRVLKALNQGFDPSERAGSIDVATLQRLLQASVEDWPSDQKHILATNLRQLAELLPAMADARTKPSLMRSDDQLERQLMSGELPPQSAIDVMRWLAGYLEGAQKNGL